MGCSPPDSWYEAQYESQRRREEADRQKRINQTINTVREMSDNEKKLLREALGL